MPRYVITLTDEEIQELEAIIQKGGKGYRIKHAQILLKLNHIPENKTWKSTNARMIHCAPLSVLMKRTSDSYRKGAFHAVQDNPKKWIQCMYAMAPQMSL